MHLYGRTWHCPGTSPGMVQLGQVSMLVSIVTVLVSIPTSSEWGLRLAQLCIRH